MEEEEEKEEAVVTPIDHMINWMSILAPGGCSVTCKSLVRFFEVIKEEDPCSDYDWTRALTCLKIQTLENDDDTSN